MAWTWVRPMDGLRRSRCSRLIPKTFNNHQPEHHSHLPKNGIWIPAFVSRLHLTRSSPKISIRTLKSNMVRLRLQATQLQQVRHQCMIKIHKRTQRARPRQKLAEDESDRLRQGSPWTVRLQDDARVPLLPDPLYRMYRTMKRRSTRNGASFSRETESPQANADRRRRSGQTILNNEQENFSKTKRSSLSWSARSKRRCFFLKARF